MKISELARFLHSAKTACREQRQASRQNQLLVVEARMSKGKGSDIVVGVDFGTQTSCVAVFRNEVVDVVANENGM